MSAEGRPGGEHRSAQRPGDRATTGPATIDVTVVWATPGVQDVVVVTLQPGSTVAAAVHGSGFVATYALDLDRLGFAVDGRRARLTTTLAHGNRIDLARPLEVDPKSIRRLRAQARPVRATAKPERQGRT